MSHDIPAPSRSDWLGRFVCKAQVQIPMGASGLTQPCDERFWFYANYEVHWLQEHAPAKALPKVEPGQGPGSLSLEEEGRRLASRRDDLIALGVPSELLAVPHAPRHRSPFTAKDAIVIQHGPDWAPQAINVNGVNYWRAGWEPGKDI